MVLSVAGRIIDDFVTAPLLAATFDAVSKFGYKYGWQSHKDFQYTHWHHEILNGGIENTENLEANLLNAKKIMHNGLIPLWQHFKENLFPGADLLRCYANQHTYGVEGYPHTDSSRSGEVTALIYLNKIWKPEWGGETVLFDGDEITQSVLPKYGRVLMFNSEQLHCARSVSRICPKSRTTLIFKVKPDETVGTVAVAKQFLRDKGAARLPHTGRSLYDHLVATHDALEAKGEPQHVCLAGLFHSVYGTNAFKNKLIPISDREAVRKVIGEQAESLAFQFCTLDRPQCFLNRQYYDRELIAIEIANLQEQQDLRILQLQKLLVETPNTAVNIGEVR